MTSLPSRTRTRTLLALALAVPLLGGCGIVYQPADSQEPAPEETATAAPADDPSGPSDPNDTEPGTAVPATSAAPSDRGADPSDEPSPADTGTDDGPAATPASWALHEADVSTVTCTDGTHSVMQTGAAVHVRGDCREVFVNADAALVLIDSSRTVTVVGNGNTVSVIAADTIAVGGDANAVEWAGGSPQVSDSGVGNTVRPAS